jgi:hypothetical protein
MPAGRIIFETSAAEAAHRKAMAGGVAVAWTFSDTKYDRVAQIDGDMKAADVGYVLEQMRFPPNGFTVLKIDRETRDYLFRLVERR